MRQKRKAKKKKSVFKKFFVFLILLSIIAGVIFAIQIQQNGGGLKGLLLTALGSNGKTLEELDTIYVLVLGVSTDLNSNLSDTIMLCGYNPKTNQAMMLSIPRDTFIGKSKSRAKGTDKINSLYAKGPEKTVEEVEKITGIDIDYYAVVNNDLVIQMVDVIGGVKFDIPINMDYDDPTQNLHIHLKKGLQTVNGEMAEQLLRFRHNNDGSSYPYEYGDNDYGRMRTQREFTKATLTQTIQAKNVFKFKNIVETVIKNCETNMLIEDILAYIPYATDLSFDTIRMEQLPGESQMCNKIWLYVYNETETKELIQNIVNTLEYGISENQEIEELDNVVKIENNVNNEEQ